MAGELRQSDRVELIAQVGAYALGERGTVLEAREAMALVQFDRTDRYGGRVQLVASYLLQRLDGEEPR